MIDVAKEVQNRIVSRLVDELYPLFKDSVMTTLGLTKVPFEKSVDIIENDYNKDLIKKTIANRQNERKDDLIIHDAASGGDRQARELKAIEDEIKDSLEDRVRTADQQAADNLKAVSESPILKKTRKPRTIKSKITEVEEDLVAVVPDITETATPIAIVLCEQEFIKTTTPDVFKTTDVFAELSEVKDVPTETPTKSTPVETETDDDFSFFADLKKAYEDPQNKVKALAKLSGTDTSDDIPF